MKNIEWEGQVKISDYIYELEQLNALIGFIQTAFAESSSVVSSKDVADALYHIYMSQSRILERMEKVMEGEK